MADTAPLRPAKRWSARRLGCLGIALPITAFIVLLIAFAIIPKGSHVVLSDAQTIGVLVAIAAVPLAAIAGIVLCVVAFIRARRERPVGGYSLAILGTVVALLIVALLVLLVWAALQGLASFR
jgi:hypothetical protein